MEAILNSRTLALPIIAHKFQRKKLNLVNGDYQVTEGIRHALIRGPIDGIINRDPDDEVRPMVRVLMVPADNAPLIDAQKRIRIGIFVRNNLL